MKEIDLYSLKLKILDIDKNIEVIKKDDLNIPIFNYNLGPGPNHIDRLKITSNIGPNVYKINKVKFELNPLANKELVIDNKCDVILLKDITQHHHMLFEMIGRILYLSKYSKNSKFDILIISEDDNTIIEDFFVKYKTLIKLLQMINITFADKYINLYEYKTLELNNLLITEYENSVMFDKYGDIARLIRNKFMIDDISNKNIYISRKNAKTNGLRKINNEELIENFYKKMDYEIVYLEYMSIKNQIDLFSNAKNVVGLTGSGLSNCVFANKDAKFLEIRNYSGYYNNDHVRIANFCNIDYDILTVEDTQNAEDIIIELEKYYKIK